MAERVLVIGGGGREHALAWKLAQSPHVQQVLVAPGNAGTAKNEKISNSAVSVNNHMVLAQYCKDHNVGLVVVGPEVPLAAGVVDDLMAAGVLCFGPSAKAAQLEASKSFSKSFMDRHNIPTARWSSFTDPQDTCRYIRGAEFPALVVKASGLAAGKGVVVARDKDEACQAVLDIMKDKAFGSAGETVVVEELLEGEEVSCLCFSDGVTVSPMPPVQDHKRLLDGDQGPNTGGMGAYCPTPQVSEEVLQEIQTSVLQKTVDGMREEGTPYVGVLYAGLMLTTEGAKVLEFNCRFGDPECQVRSSSLRSLSQVSEMGIQVFHAGTELKEGGGVMTSGGRVLTVTAVRPTLESALRSANEGVAVISFPDAVYRRDIGHRAIAHLSHSRCLTSTQSFQLLGGFAGLFDLKAAGFTDPILVSGTDGVGTKLKVAQASGVHGSLGQDLVAMCVNDVLAQGAEPLFFLDYFSCGRLDVRVTSSVIAGIADACQTAGCALLGGETAEMPGVYGPGEYDLAGFCVGAVERGAVLPRLRDITEGDLLIGIALSGLHSNGFSLVRQILQRSGLRLDSPAPFGRPGQTVGEALLTPTKIYSRLLHPILRSGAVKACAHITGGGLLENIPRVLPPELAAELDACRWRMPAVFWWLQQEGGLSLDEMSRTFNCGLGAVLVVSKPEAQRVLRLLQDQEEAWIVGSLAHRPPGETPTPDSPPYCNLNRESAYRQSKLIKPKYRTRVAVLISGTGTNLQALMEQAKKPWSSAEIVLVISNRPAVAGLKRAALAGIQTRVVDHKLCGSRAEFDGTIDKVLEELGVELVCLAGFMRILTGNFIKKWSGECQKTLILSEEVDAGAIVVQEAVPILVTDTEDSLSERIREAEHRAFPAALELVCSGAAKLRDDGRIVWSHSAQG
uniref:Phosphoribosylglycinamide formyltransferase n=1 Tax=Cyprinus carpio TaxID=7962 RepID=A0A8C2KHV9_CYPCA